VSIGAALRRIGGFTLADGLAQRNDNFLLLRAIAASLVIYGHGYAMVERRGSHELFAHMGWGTYSGDIAVDLFFVISGFLITGSFLRRRNLFEFLWARALRIYPAYLFCLVGCAFVLGPLLTTLPLHDYLRDPATGDYVLKNLRLGIDMAWNLPGVFTDNPRRSSVNGAIWTLPAEVRMYLWVATLGVTGVLARRWLANLVLPLLFVLGFFVAPVYLLTVPQPTYLRLAAMFLAGAFCYINRDRVPASGWLFLASAVLAWLLRHTPFYPYAFGIAEIAFVFWFAYRLRWHGYNRFGDYSYGIYLWGFPMQQVVAHFLPTTLPVTNAAISLPLAIVMAVVSWHLVEKPVIALKSAPKRWWTRWAQRGENAKAASDAAP